MWHWCASVPNVFYTQICHTIKSNRKLKSFLICILETLSILSPDHSPVSTLILFWGPQTQNLQMLLVQSVKHKHRKKYEVPERVHIWGQIWTPVFIIRTIMGVMGCGGGAGTPPVAPQDRSMGEGNLVSQSWARRLPFSSSIAPSGWRTIQDTPGRGVLRVSVLEISVPAGIVIWGRVLVVLRKAIKVTGVSRACNLIGAWAEEMGC